MAMSTSPSPQQFCLRWNNHQSAMVAIFEQLYKNETFVDVTLAVEGILVRAHKLVLSACSPYFQVMFASHPSKHPIIFLKDVCYSDLRALLDFMYKGEVEVDQDRLPAFLRLAESLKIRGLAEYCQEGTSHTESGKGSDGCVAYESLFETQQRIRLSLTNPTPAELLPRNAEVLSAGLLTMNSPLALTSQNLSTTSSNFALNNILKRPLESSLPYVPHRRKRGRPPRHSGSTPATVDDKEDKDVTVESKSETSIDQISDQASTNCTESGSTLDDAGGSRSNEMTPPVAASTPESQCDKTISKDTSDDTIPLPGTSRDTEEANDAGNATEVKNKKQKGRRIHSRSPASSRNPSDRSFCAEQLQEMSIRGLNLFRYASISDEGVYHCIPCGEDQVTRTFKNKYSFQRHAYLYHEGNQRKVFPCVVCGREFSRPDKLKHHLKTTHEYALPRDFSSAFYTVP